jgi:hypothetical protein
MKRLLRAALAAALVLGAAACQTTRPSGTPSGHDPVIFVHGWHLDIPNDPGVLTETIAFFAR